MRKRRKDATPRLFSTSIFTPACNPLLNTIPKQQSIKPPAKHTTTQEGTLKSVKLAMGFLEQKFDFREAASKAFPQQITSSHIKASVSKYEDKMSAASLRSVCCSCGRFVTASDIYEVDDQADLILSPRRTIHRRIVH